jgi:hypothetical protein
MADDIVSPLLLCPDFDTLFVMDRFDDAYSVDGTFESQKKLITDALVSGYTKSFARDKTPDEILHHPVNIGGKATIINNVDTSVIEKDGIVEGGVWTLKFEWNGKIRTLIRYEMNACRNIWPVEIINISHIITIGALDWDFIARYYIHVDPTKVDVKLDPNIEPDPHRKGMYHKYMPDLTLQFRSMIETRTKLPFTWTQLAFINDKLQSYEMLPSGRGTYTTITYCKRSIETRQKGFICINENTCHTNVSRGWEKIGKVIIKSFEGDWYTKYSRYA